MKRLTLFSFILVFSLASWAQSLEVERGMEHIQVSVIRPQLEFLASDWLEGRETGTKGVDIAADYIQSMFAYMGLEKVSDPGKEGSSYFSRASVPTYFQDFPLLRTKNFKTTFFKITNKDGGQEFLETLDFRSAYQREITTDASFPIYFGGYGIVDKQINHDDYSGVDLKGKAVLILSGFPGHRDTASNLCKKYAPSSKSRYARYRFLMDKVRAAEAAGASAILLYAPDWLNLTQQASNVFRYNSDDYEGDVPPERAYTNTMMMVDEEKNIPFYIVGDRVLKNGFPDFNLSDFENDGWRNMKALHKAFGTFNLELKAVAEQEIIRARNVLGMIPGKNRSEAIVVGGHYDHIGKYDGWVYNGADDNASGAVGMMTIARACLATGVQPDRTIIFAAWSAEEKGLYGSKYFVKHQLCDSVVAYLNFDMIGRKSDTDTLGNQCEYTYTSTHPELKDWAMEYSRHYNFDLDLMFQGSQKPMGGSDYASFADAGYPVVAFFTGLHPDYHMPSDEASKIDYYKMADIVKLGYLLTWRLATTGLE